MGKLKNARQELFCQNIAKGLPAYKAFTESGYTAKNDESARANASRLLTYDNIANRIAELMQKAENEAVMSAQELLQYISDVITLNIPEVLEGGPDMIKKHGDKVDRVEFDEEGRIKKLWFVSKSKNEELLAKHHKLLTEKIEHSGDAIPSVIINPVSVSKPSDKR